MDFEIETVDPQHMAALYRADHADLRAVADHCANMRAVGATGSSDMKLAASVPAIFVQKYIADNNITFAEFMRDNKHVDRFLSDPAISAFRIWQGRV